MKEKRTELLAPAGNMACLHAAITAGADAVYLGTDLFNARRGADNFDLAALSQACDYAHLRGVSLYLTLNVVILESEVAEALELARQAYRAGVDAFIVQDIGIAQELHRLIPETKIHASTQMNIHNLAGLEAAAQLGVSRVTLARELSLAQIALLAEQAAQLGIELESFVHGALCICYSGQCLMSSMIGGRSANRGLCAQACRLPYSLHNKALRKTLPAEGEHLLSPKDLCAIDLLPEMIEAGVNSFKIEGRMKSPDYVYGVTSVYRHALDRIAEGQAFSSSAEDQKALAEVFSRGFTTAYLSGQRGNEIMSYGRPNNRGVFVGRVTEAVGKTVTISSEDALHIGDVLEFWTNKGHFAYTINALDEVGKGNYRFRLEKQANKGDRVFRVRNAKAAFIDDPLEPLIPVSGKVDLVIGEPLRLSFSAAVKPGADSSQTPGAEKTTVEIEGPLVEAARTKAVEEPEVYDHIDRFGNTPFKLVDLQIHLDKGVGIGFSQLHKLRARALDELQEAMLAPYNTRALHKTVARESMPAVRKKGCAVAAFATNPACARAAKRAGAELIYVPALNYKRGQAVIAGQLSETSESAGYPKQSIIALPVVDYDYVEGTREYAGDQDVWDYVRPGKTVFTESLGQVVRAHDLGALVETGPHLPVFNDLTLEVLAGFNVQRTWLSPELSLSQIEMLGKSTPIPLGLTLIGSQELMTTEHCLLMSQGSCNQECAVCARRKSPHFLKDRKGFDFPVVTDSLGRSHLYNAVPFDAAHVLPELIQAGITACMVDTTLMNVAETTAAVQRAVRARDIALKSGDALSKKEGYTTGHLFRGVQ